MRNITYESIYSYYSAVVMIFINLKTETFCIILINIKLQHILLKEHYIYIFF